MVKIIDSGVLYEDGKIFVQDGDEKNIKAYDEFRKNTLSYPILKSHNTSGDENKLKIKFDAMASHDITYVGIIQTARASGLEKFPLPYVLTNCHNSLCAVGGTINEDDHMFGLSAAKKYGGMYVPAHIAVIHQYMREIMSGCGKMILGSVSHTRYGALGTMAIGEGGPELVKQLLNKTYDINAPKTVCVYMHGDIQNGVGPQDVALAIIKAVFPNGFVKNKILEFVGPGIKNLPIEFRNGIDVMTTETTCLSSIWETDSVVEDYFKMMGRKDAYKEMKVEKAYYDCGVDVNLSEIKPMIALPFHPSNAYTIEEFNQNAEYILNDVEKSAVEQLGVKLELKNKIKNGKMIIDQGVIAGCAGGTFDNLCAAASILEDYSIGADEFALSVYPASQPVYMELVKNGCAAKLIECGATIRTAFCGPCFGAGDVPSNNSLSIRHSTRNFPNREGSKPGAGQIASVALMDARSIAATARNKGVLTPATDLDIDLSIPQYHFDDKIYRNRVYNGIGNPDSNVELKFGPNITDWPKMSALTDDLLLKVVSIITDPVTTTDELIPSGETSSYRSNPHKLSEFALSRKDPAYVPNAKAVRTLEEQRTSGETPQELDGIYSIIKSINKDADPANIGIGSTIFANKPGDGSAREQAASCQKVLGGWANLAIEYATKRYRSNLINWGMLPFTVENNVFEKEDYIYIPDIKNAVKNAISEIKAYIIRDNNVIETTLTLSDLTPDERDIILAGCLINYYNV